MNGTEPGTATLKDWLAEELSLESSLVKNLSSLLILRSLLLLENIFRFL